MGLALAALVLFPATAHASDDDQAESKPVLALAAGGAVTFVSLGIGTMMIAQSDERGVRNTGLIGAQSGMVLAPLLAHAIVGETTRGVWFSLPLLVPVAVNSVVAGFFPNVIRRAPAGIQYTVFIAATLSIFGSTIGVLDAVRVGERKPKKASTSASTSSLTVVPMFGDGTTGALVTGNL